MATVGEEVGSTPDDELARGAERDLLHGVLGLPVADAAFGVPTAQHDPAFLLRLASRGGCCVLSTTTFLWQHVKRRDAKPTHGTV